MQLKRTFQRFFFKKTSIRVNLLAVFYVYTCVGIKEEDKTIKMQNKLKIIRTTDTGCRVYMV